MFVKSRLFFRTSNMIWNCISLRRLEAKSCAEKALAISEQSGDSAGVAEARAQIVRSLLFVSFDRPEALGEAVEMAEQHLERYRQEGDLRGEVVVAQWPTDHWPHRRKPLTRFFVLPRVLT